MGQPFKVLCTRQLAQIGTILRIALLKRLTIKVLLSSKSSKFFQVRRFFLHGLCVFFTRFRFARAWSTVLIYAKVPHIYLTLSIGQRGEQSALSEVPKAPSSLNLSSCEEISALWQSSIGFITESVLNSYSNSFLLLPSPTGQYAPILEVTASE